MGNISLSRAKYTSFPLYNIFTIHSQLSLRHSPRRPALTEWTQYDWRLQPMDHFEHHQGTKTIMEQCPIRMAQKGPRLLRARIPRVESGRPRRVKARRPIRVMVAGPDAVGNSKWLQRRENVATYLFTLVSCWTSFCHLPLTRVLLLSGRARRVMCWRRQQAKLIAHHAR